MTGTLDNGSFWFDSMDLDLASEPAPLPASADVVIIGAGFTGLWTAYYLSQLAPETAIVVIEARTAGFGASGRNGGWCMGTAMGIEALVARERSRERGLALAAAMQDTVDEVGRVCQAENIDCHFQKGGTLTVATTPFHADMLAQAEAEYVEIGFAPEDHVWLDADEARTRIAMTPNLGAMFTPHCAAIHPARLVRGLADTLRTRGVTIVEQTPAKKISPRHVLTTRGAISAPIVLRATEGYTDTIDGQQRQLLPLYSMMVATEPLPDSLWQDIGLRERETFGDLRRVVIYGQRTLDNRLAFGGRAGYYFNSGIRDTIPPADRAVQNVEKTLRQHFPMLEGYRVTHGWGGLMGMPRNWKPYVHFDADSGFGAAGGYTGEGVGASNLAARMLADLALGRDTDVARLAWAGDLPPRWEPEPLRWLGASALQFLGDRADAAEFRSGKPSKFWGGMFARLFG